MTTPPQPPSRRRRRRSSSPHALRALFERTADLYLKECYARKTPVRVDEYARQLELTYQYVARKASAVLGVPLRDYLRSRQLLHTEHLLRTTSYSTVEIAAMSAFGAPWTFYRAFKAAYGMTPGMYRNKVPK